MTAFLCLLFLTSERFSKFCAYLIRILLSRKPIRIVKIGRDRLCKSSGAPACRSRLFEHEICGRATSLSGRSLKARLRSKRANIDGCWVSVPDYFSRRSVPDAEFKLCWSASDKECSFRVLRRPQPFYFAINFDKYTWPNKKNHRYLLYTAKNVKIL